MNISIHYARIEDGNSFPIVNKIMAKYDVKREDFEPKVKDWVKEIEQKWENHPVEIYYSPKIFEMERELIFSVIVRYNTGIDIYSFHGIE